jgi:hypothetical protein
MPDLREAVAETHAAEKADNVPSVCRGYGFGEGEESDAFQHMSSDSGICPGGDRKSDPRLRRVFGVHLDSDQRQS